MADNRQSYSPWLHRLAALTAVATFILIFVGGLVTSTDSGLAVPDWPTTFGYNMFLYPLSKMIGGVLYEHSHRLIGSVVGMLTIVLVIWLWIKDSRKWMRWLGGAALIAVIAQGVLGGLRVIQQEQVLAIIHACFAQAFFALVASLVLFTSREWNEEIEVVQTNDATRLRRLGVLTTSFIYIQLIFGAVLRHTGVRLDAHLLFAALVAIHIFLLAKRILRDYLEHKRLVHSTSTLSLMLALQLMLGVGALLSVMVFKEAMPVAASVTITTAHVAVGALMLITSLVLTLRIYRSTGISETTVNQKLVSGEASA